MMDIWDEKPKPIFCDSHDWMGYCQDEMDAWLEKLKAHYAPYDMMLKTLKEPCSYCGKPMPHVQFFKNGKYEKCLTSEGSPK